MRTAVARLVSFVLAASLLAGCLVQGPPPEPPKNINPGDSGDDGSNLDGLLSGKHLNVTLDSAVLSEGGQAKLVFANAGDVALVGALTVDLVDPRGSAIARTVQDDVALEPRGKITFTWGLPGKLEGGTYAWNATLAGAAASVTAPVGGSAPPGEGPPPLGFTPIYHLEVDTDASTYERDQPVIVKLSNKGNVPVRGALAVAIHGPTTTMPQDSTHTAPEVARYALADAHIAAGTNQTLPEMTIPLGAIPTSLAQYYVFVTWAHGTAITNVYVDNRSEKPAPMPGPLAKTYEAGPTFSWDGNDTIALTDASGNPFHIYLHYAKQSDVSAGQAPLSIVPSSAYVNAIKTAFSTAWASYKADGWLLPQMPIHAYVDNPGGHALGTFQPAAYGGHIVIGPEALHTDANSNVQTTVAHELFHAFQTRYDYNEGFLIEGYATWIMDTPFPGSKDYLGQARAWLNQPDGKPIQYQEHEFVIFVKWLADHPTYGAKIKELTQNSADYDNEFVFQKTYGKTFDALWIEFVTDVAGHRIADSDTLFDTAGVFGLKAWDWYWEGSETAKLSADKLNRTLTLPVSNFEKDMIDEDVGQVKHAYGMDVYHLNGKDATTSSDSVKLTFTSLDADTQFTALLAVKSGTTWTVTTITPGAEVTVNDLKDNESLVFITRGGAGNGKYDMTMTT